MWECPLTKEPLWQEQARAVGGEALVATIENISTSQETLVTAQKTMAAAQEKMGGDIHEIKESLASLITTAFPAGDAEGHRRYHDLMIRRNEEIRRLRIAVQEKTISGLIWAFLVFLGLCIYTFLGTKLGTKS